MTFPLRARPGAARDCLDALYAGDVFLTSSPVTKELAARAMAVVEDQFATCGGAANAFQHLPNEEFFARIKALRRHFFLEPEWHRAVTAILDAAGMDPERMAFDPLRLRAISSGGHENPAAKAVYGTHRDVWYAHPRTLITWWMPLHDAAAAETFVFYPACLEREVLNDSECFDYDDWVADGPDLRIGWQDIQAGRTATFPRFLGDVDDSLGAERGFDCRLGDELLFSGAHLHRTLPHRSGRTRFSFDFRLVDLVDLREGKGAAFVDNRSRGNAVRDYRPARAAGA